MDALTPPPDRYRIMERFLRQEFRRFDVRPRELLLVDALLDISYGWGQSSVKVPTLELLQGLTGIPIKNLNDALQALVMMQIVSVDLVEGGPAYLINPHTDQWRCRTHVTRESVKEAIAFLRQHNSLGPDPSLTPPTV